MRGAVAIVVVAWGLPGVAWADTVGCSSSTRGDVAQSAREAERAFGDARPERILEEAARAREALPCVGARMLPEEVGATMRLFAYEAFVQRDVDGAKLWLESSRAAEPSYAIPMSVVPEAHPLRAMFDESAPRDRGRVPVMVPRGATLWVDGQQVGDVPLGRPSLVQVVSVASVVTVLQVDGGAPALSEPATSTVAPGPVLAMGASATLLAQEEGPQGYGGPQVRAHVPLAGVVHAEAVLGLPLTVQSGEPSSVYGLPVIQLGLVARATGSTVPWAGAGAVVLVDDDGPVVGCAAAVGVDLPVGPVRITPELRGGWAGSPLVGGGVGVAFGG